MKKYLSIITLVVLFVATVYPIPMLSIAHADYGSPGYVDGGFWLENYQTYYKYDDDATNGDLKREVSVSWVGGGPGWTGGPETARTFTKVSRERRGVYTRDDVDDPSKIRKLYSSDITTTYKYKIAGFFSDTSSVRTITGTYGYEDDLKQLNQTSENVPVMVEPSPDQFGETSFSSKYDEETNYNVAKRASLKMSYNINKVADRNPKLKGGFLYFPITVERLEFNFSEETGITLVGQGQGKVNCNSITVGGNRAYLVGGTTCYASVAWKRPGMFTSNLIDVTPNVAGGGYYSFSFGIPTTVAPLSPATTVSPTPVAEPNNKIPSTNTRGTSNSGRSLATVSEIPSSLLSLTPGSRGADVVTLQDYLIEHGYLAQGNNTGYYGALTESAVIRYRVDQATFVRQPTSTLAPTPAHSPSLTPYHSLTPTPTPYVAPTPNPTPYVVPTPTPYITPTPTVTPTPTPSPIPTATPTPSPISTPTPSPTPTATLYPSPSSSPRPSSSPSAMMVDDTRVQASIWQAVAEWFMGR